MKFGKAGRIITALTLSVSILAGGATPALADDLSEITSASEEIPVEDLYETVPEGEEEIDLAEEESGEEIDLSEEESADAGLAYDSSSVEEIVTEEAVALAATEGKYLKELRIASADSEKAAKDMLTQAGYAVIDQNVNKDADVLLSDAKAVYIGYQTTDDATEAIRDISLMNMTGGYVITDYETAMADMMSQLEITEADHITMIREFRKNYEAGSPIAIMAYEELNRFIEDDSGKLVGDYLLEVDLTPSTEDHISDFLTFYSTISKNALGIIDTWLAYSLASYGEDIFPKRIAAMSESEIENAKTDRVNISNAETLLSYMQTYADALNAIAEDIDEADVSADQVEEVAEGELTEEESYLVLSDGYFDYLASFAYGEETLLDLLMNEDLAAEDLIPLVSQMSDAQIAAVKYVGFDLVLKSEAMDANTWSRDGEQSDIQKEISNRIDLAVTEACAESAVYEESLQEGQPLSIYYGIDRTVIDGPIAITSDALRQMQASSDYSAMAGGGGLSVYAWLAGSIGAAVSIGLLGYGVYMLRKAKADLVQQGIYYIMHVDDPDIVVTKPQMNGAWVAAGKVSIGASIALLAIIIGGLILWNEYTSRHKTFDKSLIPEVILDLRTTDSGIPYYVRYTSVKEFTTTDGRLDPGDVNGYVGDEWNVLYTTSNVDAGAPVQANFRVVTDKAELKANELGIHAFGSTTEENLNSYTYNSSAPKIYIYAQTGIVTGLLGSIFSGTGGYAVAFILGILLGLLAMALLAYISGRRRRMADNIK